MQILRNFSKTIRISLQILALVLIAIAAILMLTQPLFIGHAQVIDKFQIYTREGISYSIPGLITFSDTLVSNIHQNSSLNLIIPLNNELLHTANMLKTLSIALIVILALTLVFQIFEVRLYDSFVCSVSSLVIFSIIVHICRSNFMESKLILKNTGVVPACISLLAIATFLFIVEFVILMITRNNKDLNTIENTDVKTNEDKEEVNQEVIEGQE